KTIDNDICETDVTFGYDSAITTAVESLDKLHTTAESHHRAMVVEVMGRNAGWIALEAGISGDADVILIPEIPFNMEKVCDKIYDRVERGSMYSIVVVAEGAAPQGGKKVFKTMDNNSESKILGGIGNSVGREIHERTGIDTRITVLGHIQRGGSPTPFDRLLGSRFGVHTLHLIARGKFGRMVALKGRYIESVPIEKAVRRTKLVDPDDQMVKSAESIGICFGR
ncbi:MAG: 6-phosphofructokinase, partial [Fidelibacterota bacterium]